MTLRIFSSFIVLVLPLILAAYAYGEDIIVEDISPLPDKASKVTSPSRLEVMLKETDNLIREAEKALIYSKKKKTQLAVKYGFGKTALLKGLNKITARTSSLIATKEKAVTFGNLEIILYECWKAPPTEEAETKALIEIWERRQSDPVDAKKRVFFGWMFASSPALSSLEHPVYDITIRDCVG